MHFMNFYDIQDQWERVNINDTPNLAKAILALRRLAMWANKNSDGWAFWPKPARSAKRLMELIESVDRHDPEDITPAQLKAALSPVKAFLTRQGVDHSEVLA